MNLLLPPSEAKHPGGRGRPLAGRSDASPLALARARCADALAATLAAPDATARLLLPPGVAAEALAADAAVQTSPTMPAIARYRGVVYDGLDYRGLSAPARRRAGTSVWVFSGLFGVLRGDEPVPDYRVPAAAKLVGLGVAGTYWRAVLHGVVPGLLRPGPVIDLRSSDYAAMWRPGRDLAARTVAVRILSPAPDGTLKVISYRSKHAKGRLAAALLERLAAGETPRGGEDVADVWLAIGGADARPGRSGGLDLIEA